MNDWATYNHKPAPRPDPPAPKLLEMCWRMLGPSNKPIECGIYVQSFGFDLRVGYGGDDVIRTQWVHTVDRGRELAAEWQQASLAKGFTGLVAAPKEAIEMRTWDETLTHWLHSAMPKLIAHNHEVAKGERGVMMVPVDVPTMDDKQTGASDRLEPVWQPASEFISILKASRSVISNQSLSAWERTLAVMDPQRDVALFFASTQPDATGKFFTRFIVTHDGNVTAN